VRPKRLAAAVVFPLALAFWLLTAAAPSALASDPKVNVTPNPSAPGTPTIFSIVCGSSATSAALFGATLGLGGEIPMQPVTRAGEFALTATVPATTSPGLYIVAIRCSNGFAANAALTVGSGPRQAPRAGDGTTSIAAHTAAIAAGTGVLGVAALVGGVLLYLRKLGRWH
jgi:hypothetical protein